MCIAVAPPPKKSAEKNCLIKKAGMTLLWPLRAMKPLVAWARVDNSGGNACGTACGKSCRTLR